MNPLDIGVIAVIALSAVFAFARGFVREALSIVAWVSAGAITLYGFGWAYAIIDPMVGNPLLTQLIAGFGLFVGSLIVLTLITGLIARTVRSSALSPIDRTLGFIFGLARGAFIVSIAYLLVDYSLPATDQPGWVRNAKSAPYLQEGANLLRGILPESLKSKTANALDDTIKTMAPAVEADKAIRAYVRPSPAPATPPPPSQPAAGTQDVPTAAPAAPVYRAGDRQNLDRLIETRP